ncbi:MAG TPA: hypothetical protein VFK69_06880, partial [Candidatus Eisenbacteria bacterium]|nr:hypothetical protein [Candidatus Eisenbacteria bacterium]
AARARAPHLAATPAQLRAGRALVARALVAHGGIERFRRLEDSVMDGAMTIHSPDGHELSGKFEQVRKEPWKMVMTTGFMGFETQQILDGRRGWSRYEGDSVSVADADSTTIQAMRSGFGSDLWHLLLALEQPGARVAARSGAATIDGRPADALDALTADGEPRRLYFDRVTHRLVAMDQNEDRPGSGRFLARRVYRDYHVVDGMQWPFYEQRLLGGQRVMELTLSRLAFNTGVEDAAFRKPALPEPGFRH